MEIGNIGEKIEWLSVGTALEKIQIGDRVELCASKGVLRRSRQDALRGPEPAETIAELKKESEAWKRKYESVELAVEQSKSVEQSLRNQLQEKEGSLRDIKKQSMKFEAQALAAENLNALMMEKILEKVNQ